jgi:hypothetical protein
MIISNAVTKKLVFLVKLDSMWVTGGKMLNRMLGLLTRLFLKII